MPSRLIRTVMLACLFAGSVTAQGRAEPIKIGVIATLTGPLGGLGQHLRDAVTLAVEQAGGKIGDRPVELVIGDDQAKPDVGLQLVDRFTKREKVALIIGVQPSNVMMAVVQPIAASKTFLIGTLAGPAPLAGANCSPFFFSASTENDELHGAIGEVVKKLGYKKVLAIVPNYQAGKDAMAGFKEAYGSPLVDEIYPKLNELDLASEITTIANDAPDAVYAFMPGAMAVSFVKQYAQAGLLHKIPLYTASTISSVVLKGIGDDALGLYSATNWSADLDNPANKAFVASFRQKYGYPPSEFAAWAFDAGQLAMSALTKVNGNSTDTDALGSALKAADFPSVRGRFRFNNNHFPIDDFFYTEVVRAPDGGLTQVRRGDIYKDGVDPMAKFCPMK